MPKYNMQFETGSSVLKSVISKCYFLAAQLGQIGLDARSSLYDNAILADEV